MKNRNSSIIKVVLFISGLFFSCNLDSDIKVPEIEIDVTTNSIIKINGEDYSINVFDSVFLERHKKIITGNNGKYNVRMRVHKGITMGTIQSIKEELAKVKRNIKTIYYSAEPLDMKVETTD